MLAFCFLISLCNNESNSVSVCIENRSTRSAVLSYSGTSNRKYICIHRTEREQLSDGRCSDNGWNNSTWSVGVDLFRRVSSEHYRCSLRAVRKIRNVMC